MRVDSPIIGNEEQPLEALRLNGPFSLINFIILHFGVTGFRLIINSDIPVGSGLGGSGSVAVAVIAAISSALARARKTQMLDRSAIAYLAHQLENGIQASLTGLQDQLAAVYGGVYQWTWKYSRSKQPYNRRALMKAGGMDRLASRIAVALTGEQRNSTAVSKEYIADYLAGTTREEWIRISQLSADFADALAAESWAHAADALRDEMALREHIYPYLWPDSALPLKTAARRLHCTLRTGGGNRAGCIWAFGEPEAIRLLRNEWGTANLELGVSRNGLLLTSGAAS